MNGYGPYGGGAGYNNMPMSPWMGYGFGAGNIGYPSMYPWGMLPPAAFLPTPGYMEVDTVLDDEDIEENVRGNIDLDPYIPRKDKNAIDIKVSGGTVTLSGTVRNKRTKPLAYGDAFWSLGTLDVENNIQVESGTMPMPKGKGETGKAQED